MQAIYLRHWIAEKKKSHEVSSAVSSQTVNRVT